MITLVILDVFCVVIAFRRRQKAREYDQQSTGNDSTDFLQSGDITRITEDNKSQRYSQYGYTHVWELRNLKSLNDENNSVKTLPSTFKPRPEVPIYCEHSYKCRDHMYESPSHRAHVIYGTQTPGGATLYNDMDAPPGEGEILQGQVIMDVDLVPATNNRIATTP